MNVSALQIADLASRIREAIGEELRASARGLPFKVWDVVAVGGLLHLTVESADRRSVLDESLEEGRIGWVSETSGSAEIVSVLPAGAIVNACLTEGRPPRVGTIIYINPPRYLEALLQLWKSDEWTSRFVKAYYRFNENSETWTGEVPVGRFSDLRPAQRRSFGLVRWQTSFLWGPPGTGKTHTLGRLLASHLVARPAERVLLLSSTNIAVDLAILAIDDSLALMGETRGQLCYRFGSRFDPQRFHSRKHLIPLRNRDLVDALRRHHESVPAPADAERYHQWKKERDGIRAAIRSENMEFLSRTRLVAMTTTLAVHDLPNLGSFDLVVFDEASQVGKAPAITLGHLGKRVLYAGDPKQLNPIAQANSENVDAWLAASPFDWIARSSLKSATCMLDEQWRMAPDICAVVSKTSYESKLRVAEPARTDVKWIAHRTAKPTKLLRNENVVLIDTQAAPRPPLGFNGYECAESARLVTALVVDHILSWEIQDIKSEILVVTPFRAQRRKIEQELNAIGAPQSVASTVHRAQGSERRVVIFDPVCPTADFVNGKDGHRLLNVGFSRAQCRLIVMLQRGWEAHPFLAAIALDHRPIVLSASVVDSLLLTKLRPRPTSQATPAAAPKIVSRPTDLRADFRAELHRRLSPGMPPRHVKEMAVTLRAQSRFRPLTDVDVQSIIDETRS